MKSVRLLYVALLIISIIGANSSALASSNLSDELEKEKIYDHMRQAENKFKDLTSHIDPRIQDKNHIQKMTEILSLVDPSGRENVIFLDADGSILSNKIELIEEFKEQNANLIDEKGKLKQPITTKALTSLSDQGTGLLTSSNTSSWTGWKYPEAACPSVKTGPYRKVTTQQGYSRMQATIKLPTKNQGIIMTPTASSEDKGYVYMGATDKRNNQIDAGVAFNYGAGPYYWNEAWDMFIAGADPGSSPGFGTFKPGWAVMKFYIPEDNKIVLEVTGTNKKNNELATFTVAANVTGWLKDFNANGSQVTLKRVTSIAQEKEDLTTGSILGSSSDPVKWESVKIGTSTSNMIYPTIGYFCGYQVSNVLVNFKDHSYEDVRIKTGTLSP